VAFKAFKIEIFTSHLSFFRKVSKRMLVQDFYKSYNKTLPAHSVCGIFIVVGTAQCLIRYM